MFSLNFNLMKHLGSSVTSSDFLFKIAFDLKFEEINTKRSILIEHVNKYEKAFTTATAEYDVLRDQLVRVDDVRKHLSFEMDGIVEKEMKLDQQNEFREANFEPSDKVLEYHSTSEEFKRILTEYNNSCIILKELNRILKNKKQDLYQIDMAILELQRLKFQVMHVQEIDAGYDTVAMANVVTIDENNKISPSAPLALENSNIL